MQKKFNKELIGSSNTIEGIAKILNDYYYTKNYSVCNETLKILNAVMNSVRLEYINRKFSVCKKEDSFELIDNLPHPQIK